MQNTGSFAAATGGMTPELQAAMQRRQGGGGGAMSQVTNTAPTADPTTQVPTQAQAPSGGGMAPQPQGIPQGANIQQASTEAKIIIQALKGRLDALSKGGVLS